MSAPTPDTTTTTVTVVEEAKPATNTTTTEDPAAPSDPNSPLLQLVIATAEEALAQSHKNATSWRGPLQLEAYLRRESHLASQAFTRDGGLTTWVLVSTAVDPSKRKVLAGCETYRKRALVTKKGKVEEVMAHGIGSVFSEYRGRGYGARMMKELGEKLRTWQVVKQPCLFSILYSDIGKNFYARLGWEPFPSSHIHIRPKAHPLLWEGHKHATPLHMTDLPAFCALDEDLMRKRLEKYKSGNAVALVPDYKTIEWHHAREEFVANELLGKAPYVKGATVTVNGQRVHAVWTRVFGNATPGQTEGNTMHILRIVVEDEDLDIESEDFSPDHIAGIAAVLRVAQKEAHEWHMNEIELWNPHPRTLIAAQSIDSSAKLIHRDAESIASLKWYGGGEEPVTWLENEKYGWC